MSWTGVLKSFAIFIEAIIITGVFALQLFGLGDGIYHFVQKPVIILFYIASVIALFANLFQHIHYSMTYSQHFLYKLVKWIKILLVIGSRVVFQVVIVWTIVNASQYRKERTVDFGYGLGFINVIIILLTLTESFLPEKDLSKQKTKAQ